MESEQKAQEMRESYVRFSFSFSAGLLCSLSIDVFLRLQSQFSACSSSMPIHDFGMSYHQNSPLALFFKPPPSLLIISSSSFSKSKNPERRIWSAQFANLYASFWIVPMGYGCWLAYALSALGSDDYFSPITVDEWKVASQSINTDVIQWNCRDYRDPVSLCGRYVGGWVL